MQDHDQRVHILEKDLPVEWDLRGKWVQASETDVAAVVPHDEALQQESAKTTQGSEGPHNRRGDGSSTSEDVDFARTDLVIGVRDGMGRPQRDV